MTLEDSVRRHRLAILQRAALLSNVTQACREAGISRTLFYRWRRRSLRYGAEGLRPRPMRPTRWPRQAIPALEHVVLAYALLWPTHGPARIALSQHLVHTGHTRVAGGYYLDEVIQAPLAYHDGCRQVPDASGLGLELDEERVSGYRVQAF